MALSSAPLEIETKGGKKSDSGYLVLHSSYMDLDKLRNKDPMILDAGVVVFVCRKGEGKIVVDMNTYHIRRGSFMLLLPYSVIQILEISDDTEVSLVATGFGFLERLVMLQPVENHIAKMSESPCLQLNDTQLAYVKNTYEFVEKQYAETSGPLAYEIRNTLMTFIALEIVSMYVLDQPTGKRKLSRHEQVFRKFTLSLAKNFREHRTVEFYADEACLSSKHFSSVIKQRSGKLPSEWITERTVILIKFLLENSDMSVQEIANELNFPNQSFFTRYFKKNVGITPSMYRNQNAAQQ